MSARSDNNARLQRLMAVLDNTILSRMVRYRVLFNQQHCTLAGSMHVASDDSDALAAPCVDS